MAHFKTQSVKGSQAMLLPQNMIKHGHGQIGTMFFHFKRVELNLSEAVQVIRALEILNDV